LRDTLIKLGKNLHGVRLPASGYASEGCTELVWVYLRRRGRTLVDEYGNTIEGLAPDSDRLTERTLEVPRWFEGSFLPRLSKERQSPPRHDR